MPRDNSIPAHWNRELNMTEPEESVLVEMASYFLEMGWINEETEKHFDSLVEKICAPAPWDYSVNE